MPCYYYGTLPVLAWIINHYFYAGVHHVWLAAEWYPVLTNPKSSNPHLIYADLYHAWVARDGTDKFVETTRKRLRRAVRAQERRRVLDNLTAVRLRRVCLNVAVDLFYPVVYRVDIDAIAGARMERPIPVPGRSREVLLSDLREGEFDLLFADNLGDDVFEQLVLAEIEGGRQTRPQDVLALLEAERMP
jgi:hypothetical protein